MNRDVATIIRTFRAPDARQALAAVKAALGADAVVIGSRQLSGGIFGRPQVEVTAASPSSAEPARSGTKLPATSTGLNASGQVDFAAFTRVMEDVRRSLDRTGGGPEAGSRNRARTADRPERNPGRPDEPDDVSHLGSHARKLHRRLVERGLEPTLARAWIETAVDAGADRTAELEARVAASARKLLLPAATPWSADARRTVALVGPTGVGKTTAIAKIAARALLETRFKVGLITVDTYRVGASDQLTRYGRIMNAPTYVARDRQTLLEAIDRTSDADLVLIDTAGRSDTESLAAQMELVRHAPNVQMNLVVSLVAGARDLAAIARRYKGFGVERLIFTKLDEAEAPAAGFSAATVVQRPVACFCDGQRVPEDIHPVSDSNLLEACLGFGAELAPGHSPGLGLGLGAARPSRRASYAPMGSISAVDSQAADDKEQVRGPSR
jgi:flagellar biosynthesis protein FlhF